MRIPSYRKHTSGSARVTIQGKDYLLREYGSPESKTTYNRIIGEFIASNCSPVFREKPSKLTMAQVSLAFLNHAETYYVQGKEYEQFKVACKPISELYADTLASAFSSVEYKACRAWWLTGNTRTRQYVYKQARRLVAIVNWSVAEGLMPAANYQAIKCVDTLRFGRTQAPVAKPVVPVPDEIVAATLPHLTTVVADMVRFQMATGCRPGEVCKIKPSMVDRSRDVWEINLTEHKTAYRGKHRVIYCGPHAQAILSKYLLRDGNSHCFSPRESEKQRRQNVHEQRTTPLSCGNRPGTNVVSGKRKNEPGECYKTSSYGHSIKHACKKAFPVPDGVNADQSKEWIRSHSWAPNQIRHSVATKIRKEYGLEATARILGHSQIGVTQVYAEADKSRALEVARKFG